MQKNESSPPSKELVLCDNRAQEPLAEANQAGVAPNGIFGSLRVGENEFAISVRAIREVVNEPPSYDTVPLSPPHLLGLFNLRGEIVPVVDLQRIFKLEIDRDTDPRAAGEPSRKIAIIEHGEHCVGLRFDKTGEVFSGHHAKWTAFTRRAQTEREAIVSGVFKFPEADHLVQVLDPYEIIGLDRVPRADGRREKSAAARKLGAKLQCISFMVGESCCGFDMKAINEIVELENIQTNVLSEGYRMGTITIRGDTVPVVDFQAYMSEIGQVKTAGPDNGSTQIDLAQSDLAQSDLSHNDAKQSDKQHYRGYKVIVMKQQDRQIGLVVEAINNIVSYYDDELVTFPVLGDHRNEIFKGGIAHNDLPIVLLLDHEELLNCNELLDVTDGHSMLFEEEVQAASQIRADQSLSKRTMMTFSASGDYALDILHVNEVIDPPPDLVRPPSSSPALDGMVNLRGELIPLINPRALYSIDEDSPEGQKVLIFSTSYGKYGLLVDAVTSILALTNAQLIDLPRLGEEGDGQGIVKDIAEALMVKSGPEKNRTILVLDPEAMVRRCIATCTNAA